MINSNFNQIFVFFNYSGYSIRCFECNSHTDPRCAEKIPPNELEKECSEHKSGPKYTFCRKITQEIDFTVNNSELQPI